MKSLKQKVSQDQKKLAVLHKYNDRLFSLAGQDSEKYDIPIEIKKKLNGMKQESSDEQGDDVIFNYPSNKNKNNATTPSQSKQQPQYPPEQIPQQQPEHFHTPHAQQRDYRQQQQQQRDQDEQKFIKPIPNYNYSNHKPIIKQQNKQQENQYNDGSFLNQVKEYILPQKPHQKVNKQYPNLEILEREDEEEDYYQESHNQIKQKNLRNTPNQNKNLPKSKMIPQSDEDEEYQQQQQHQYSQPPKRQQQQQKGQKYYHLDEEDDNQRRIQEQDHNKKVDQKNQKARNQNIPLNDKNVIYPSQRNPQQQKHQIQKEEYDEEEEDEVEQEEEDQEEEEQKQDKIKKIQKKQNTNMNRNDFDHPDNNHFSSPSNQKTQPNGKNYSKSKNNEIIDYSPSNNKSKSRKGDLNYQNQNKTKDFEEEEEDDDEEEGIKNNKKKQNKSILKDRNQSRYTDDGLNSKNKLNQSNLSQPSNTQKKKKNKEEKIDRDPNDDYEQDEEQDETIYVIVPANSSKNKKKNPKPQYPTVPPFDPSYRNAYQQEPQYQYQQQQPQQYLPYNNNEQYYHYPQNQYNDPSYMQQQPQYIQQYVEEYPSKLNLDFSSYHNSKIYSQQSQASIPSSQKEYQIQVVEVLEEIESIEPEQQPVPQYEPEVVFENKQRDEGVDNIYVSSNTPKEIEEQKEEEDDEIDENKQISFDPNLNKNYFKYLEMREQIQKEEGGENEEDVADQPPPQQYIPKETNTVSIQTSDWLKDSWKHSKHSEEQSPKPVIFDPNLNKNYFKFLQMEDDIKKEREGSPFLPNHSQKSEDSNGKNVFYNEKLSFANNNNNNNNSLKEQERQLEEERMKQLLHSQMQQEQEYNGRNENINANQNKPQQQFKSIQKSNNFASPNNRNQDNSNIVKSQLQEQDNYTIPVPSQTLQHSLMQVASAQRNKNNNKLDASRLQQSTSQPYKSTKFSQISSPKIVINEYQPPQKEEPSRNKQDPSPNNKSNLLTSNYKSNLPYPIQQSKYITSSNHLFNNNSHLPFNTNNDFLKSKAMESIHSSQNEFYCDEEIETLQPDKPYPLEFSMKGTTNENKKNPTINSSISGRLPDKQISSVRSPSPNLLNLSQNQKNTSSRKN